MASALGDRGCTCFFEGDGPFDAAVLAEGFEQLADPVETLRSLAKLAAENAPIVAVAANAAHASARLRAVKGDVADSGALPGRAYDLAALEHVVRDAGLVISERLRHVAPVAAETLDAVVPGLSAVVSGPEADTASYVLVLSRSDHDGRINAPTVADALQAELDRVAAELVQATAELTRVQAELAAVSAERDAATETAEAHQRALAEREEALAERVAIVERLHTERQHLELEIVVKDDYIAVLRQDRNDWRNFQKITQHEIDELRRSRHYQVAAILHNILLSIPFAHRAAKRAAKVAARAKTTSPPS